MTQINILIAFCMLFYFSLIQAVLHDNLVSRFFTGISAADESGFSVSGAGDVNGDGLPDVLIGAKAVNSNNGEGYIVFSKDHKDIDQRTLSLSSLDGSNGFKIPGKSNSFLGWSVSMAGDINDDGYGDFLLGAWGVNADDGEAYLIHGKGTSWPSSFDVNSLDGTNGVTFKMTDGLKDKIGRKVSRAGDFNGDGFDDFLIAVYKADLATGMVALVYGHAGPWSSGTIDLASVGNSTAGVQFLGNSTGDELGWSIGNAGDVNNDGYDDILMAADHFNPGSRPNDGGVFLIFGGANPFPLGSFNVTDVDGTNGVQINGIGAAFFAESVQTAGDVNLDGYSDFLIGAPYLGVSGTAFLVLGHATPWTNPMELIPANGTDVVQINGTGSGSNAGWAVSPAGDVNGDSFDDFCIGSPNANSNAGMVSLILGNSTWPPSIDLTYVDITLGYQLEVGGVKSGYSIAAAGDTDGDGYPNILIGAPNTDSSAGKTFLFNPGCNSGEYYDPDTSECHSCPPGEYNLANFKTECFQCSAGTYQDQYGISFCPVCPDGYAQPFKGQSFCFQCYPDYVPNEEHTDCVPEEASPGKTSPDTPTTDPVGLTVGLVLGFAAVAGGLIFLYRKQQLQMAGGHDATNDTPKVNDDVDV